MTELSPDTARIVEAFDDYYEMPHDDNWQELCIAAVLRAAVDQVVPADPCGNDCCITQCEQIRADFLAIAAELKASCLTSFSG